MLLNSRFDESFLGVRKTLRKQDERSIEEPEAELYSLDMVQLTC